MRLYFLRHAHAELPIDISDDARRLTDKGIKRAQSAGRVMNALGVAPAYIYTSPRTRAQQTAEIVARALNMRAEVRPELNFSFDLAALQALIAPLNPTDDVILVGHEPTFSMTIGDLTGGTMQMRKCGLARVDVTRTAPLRGYLAWLIPPKLFHIMDRA